VTAVTTLPLATGAELGLSSTRGQLGLLVLGGTTRALVPGRLSPSMTWLLGRLKDETADLTVAELRYNIGSWRRLDLLVADATSAIDALGSLGATRVAIIGFSGGGAAGLGALGHPLAQTLIALAPWLPPQLDPPRLDGRHVAVAHGTLDGLPLLPGTRPRASRQSVERLRALGADATWTPITGGVHGVAFAVGGRIFPAPRAHAWLAFVARELAHFQDGAGS
jgi:predicted esterase